MYTSMWEEDVGPCWLEQNRWFGWGLLPTVAVVSLWIPAYFTVILVALVGFIFGMVLESSARQRDEAERQSGVGSASSAGAAGATRDDSA